MIWQAPIYGESIRTGRFLGHSETARLRAVWVVEERDIKYGGFLSQYVIQPAVRKDHKRIYNRGKWL